MASKARLQKAGKQLLIDHEPRCIAEATIGIVLNTVKASMPTGGCPRQTKHLAACSVEKLVFTGF